MSDLGEQLRQIRLAKRLTQTDVAQAMDVSTGAVGHWETGTRPIAIESLEAFARAVGAEVEIRVVDTTQVTTPAHRELLATIQRLAPHLRDDDFLDAQALLQSRHDRRRA
jgi:transcriptional regulator with XRE-family HTH domain